MNNLMIDLETLGTSPGCVVLSIGAVFFDEVGLGAKFHRHISVQDSVQHGLTIDGDTALWWLGQTDDARQGVLSGQKEAVPLLEACKEFADFINMYGSNPKVWGNGASFDNPILAELYKRRGVPTPWKFWNDRCYRTKAAEYPDVRMEREGVHHNALNDAVSQAKHLQAIWRYASDPRR